MNWKHNRELGDDEDWDGDDGNSSEWLSLITPSFVPVSVNDTLGTGSDWMDLFTEANAYLSLHVIFTYIFTFLTLYFTYQNYKRFIRSRQLFSLELVHSIPARTVLVTNLPKQLQGERALAEYFENMNMAVESVTVCREVSGLKRLLDKRTRALLALERAWVQYVGNPSTVEEYDPETSGAPLVDVDVESGPGRLVVPHRRRPTIRPSWFDAPVDALEHLETEFKKADEAVKKKRGTGKFKATETAFVTFEKMSSAQIALQAVHAPHPFQCTTYQAPEPRDIVWANMTPSGRNLKVRDFLVLAALAFLFFTWIFPITALASLLSYNEIKKVMPWLARLIDSNDRIRALVQNTLPSMAMIILNACLPFALEGLTYLQGYRARSWIEYSLLRKYFLFLLVNVVFIFLLASTYLQLIRDFVDYPAKIPVKLAKALQAGRARNFFLSYVILQGMGVMPLQLLNLGVVIPHFFLRLFVTRTPRDFAELNAPPMVNYGVVYPQSILIFTIVLLYSVVQPLILIFGAIYFGMAYVVYKYKLLFVFYKPYESQGQAWPLTFIRLIWGVVIFLVFMTGFFLLSESFKLASALVVLLVGTVFWAWWVESSFRPLSDFVSLSSTYEVERGEESSDVIRLRAGHPVTWSQSHLNRRRYAQNDDTLYVAPEDERTDYSQPPMANFYGGVLNTGKRRYGHPALNGVLPVPWLPLKKGQTLVNGERAAHRVGSKDNNQAVVLTLRKRPSVVRRSTRGPPSSTPIGITVDPSTPDPTTSRNPWEDTHSPRRSQTLPTPNTVNHRLSYDHATGVIMLPDDETWLVDDVDSEEEEDYGVPDEEPPLTRAQTEPPILSSSVLSSSPTPSRLSRYGTYFHHPERRRQPIPGAFPR